MNLVQRTLSNMPVGIPLTMNWIIDTYIDTMKTKKVKTSINKLIQKLGSVEAVAERLDITTRWVIYLSSGKRECSSALAKIIQWEVGK